MAYRVRIAARTRRQIHELATYLGDYSEEFAHDQLVRLGRTISQIADAPFMWSYFPVLGPPFRGYLFRVGRRSQYWIIYTVDEPTEIVNIIHFWNARRDPQQLDV